MASGLICGNKGCGKPFKESENTEASCCYHSGVPQFVDGSKGWSCCPKVVYDFDNFLKIAGCKVGLHAAAAKKEANVEKSPSAPAPTKVANGVEVYGNTQPQTQKAAAASIAPPPAKINEVDLMDPEDAVIANGTKCLRPSCTVVYPPPTEECSFHSGEPVFHEGSKGWSCCKPRVLEFEEFMKLSTCCTGKHRFTGEDSKVKCRHDWYQTPTQVIVSVFAKKCDKKLTKVVISETSIAIDIVFQDGKMGSFSKDLCQPVDTAESTFNIYGTKIEINLKKTNGMSWPSLDPTDGNVKSWTTFGTTGGRGTVGSKEAIIASDSPVQLLS